MIKLLLADDEPLFRDYIENVVNWNELGFEIVAKKKNGREVMEFLTTDEADVALLDINMPFYDGIELTEKIRELHSEMIIVFITGYSEFEYAQKALSLDVTSYILKPFTKEEMLEVVGRIKEKYQKKIINQNQKNKVNRYNETDFLRKLLSSTSDKFVYEGKQDVFGYPFFLVSLLEVPLTELKNNQFVMRFNKMMKSIIPKNLDFKLLHWKDKQFVLFFNCASIPDQTSILTILNECQQLLEKELRISLKIGVGTFVEGDYALRSSYLAATNAIKDSYIFPSKTIFFPRNYLSDTRLNVFRALDIQIQLEFALKKKDSEKIHEILYELKDFMIHNSFTVEYIQTVLKNVIAIREEYIDRNNKYIEYFTPVDEQKVMELNLDQSIDWIVELFTSIKISVNHSTKRSLELVDKIKSSIETSYSDSTLSIENIASSMHLDTSYIRRVFKKETGIKLSDYLTIIRMENARKLLIEKKITISEVAFSTGYNDASYFSKTFKKYYGYSPSSLQK